MKKIRLRTHGTSTTAARMNRHWVKPEPAPCTSSSVPECDRVHKMRTTILSPNRNLKTFTKYAAGQKLLSTLKKLMIQFLFPKEHPHRTWSISEAYGDARMPNWPHRHRTHLPGIASPGLRRNKGGHMTC